MKTQAFYPALGLALIAGAATAHAQTVYTQEIADPALTTVVTQPAPPVITETSDGVMVQPMQTLAPAGVVQTTTTETVRTVRPARHLARRVVTTRTVTRRIQRTPATVAETVTTAPQPIYDEVTSAPVGVAPTYSPPLYDQVSAPAAVAPAPVFDAVGPVATQPFMYRYDYQPDRILVIDPRTGIAVQSIPR